MTLGIIAGVSQELPEGLESKPHYHRGTKLDVVGLGPLVGQAGKIQVRPGVTEHGKLGKVGFLESGALAVIRAGVTVLIAGRVDGGLGAAFCDQTLSSGQVDGGLQQLQEALFLSIRCSA